MANLRNSLQCSMHNIIVFWKINHINVYTFIDLAEYIKNSDAC